MYAIEKTWTTRAMDVTIRNIRTVRLSMSTPIGIVSALPDV